MRLESTEREGDYNVWMTDDELEELRRHASHHRDDLIIQLGGYVGLRSFEVPQVAPQHVKRTGDGQRYHLRVPAGKDTTGGEGKPRDAYLPRDVEGALHRHQSAENLAPDESYIDLKPRGVQGVVKRTARRCADATGDDDYRHVSSHDLRRRFAQRLLVDKQMNPRVVMAVGGWDSFQAIEPYLNEPTPEVVNEAFEEAGIG